jgi:hypothetical protein
MQIVVPVRRFGFGDYFMPSAFDQYVAVRAAGAYDVTVSEVKRLQISNGYSA